MMCEKENFMSRFVIQKPEKEVITLRIASNLLHEVDIKANEADVSRNELINQMITFALSSMSPEPSEK